jgi:hypothetical protein
MIDPTVVNLGPEEQRVLRRVVEHGLYRPERYADSVAMEVLLRAGFVDRVDVYKPSDAGIEALRQIDGLPRLPSPLAGVRGQG